MNSGRVIRLDHVAKSYRVLGSSLAVLSDVCLDVDQGETVALLGVSGSGKSTLLNLIGGLDVPEAGRITVCGIEPSRLRAGALAAFRSRHLGFVFQRFNLLSGFSAIENVMIPARLLGARGRGAVSTAANVLEQVGLGEKMHRKPHELSVGEMQRVAIARAVVAKPSVILADEPTGNLDEDNKVAITELLLSLASHGSAVIVATHDATVAAYCQRAYELKRGALCAAR
jgi:lipoprotein-releasing system ATP-binding protein